MHVHQCKAYVCVGAACTSMPASGEEDRLTVNWAEWRKGYSYSVSTQLHGALLRPKNVVRAL